MEMKIMNQEYIRLKVISEWSGLSTATLRKYIKQKKLNAIKIGGNYCVNINSYEEFKVNLCLIDKGIKVDELDKFKEYLLKEQREQQQKLYKEFLKSTGMDDKNAEMISSLYKT